MVPTPKPSTGAPARTRASMRYSSRSLEARILVTRSPAASSIRRALRACSARSPESMRMPARVTPAARDAAIALATPRSTS